MTKVMIVDNSKLIKRMIRDIAEKQQCTIIEASTADEAVIRYKDEKPDMVFMDIMLGTKNGIEALKEIKEFDDKAVIIICTSIIGQEEVIEKAYRFGATDYITKPFSDEEIIELINRHSK
ncbi:MAG: response regulator [Candidatus Woesearchaeota archaeon]